MTVPDVAPMVVVPAPELVAKPEPLTTATPLLEELQVAVAVMSCVLPSLNVPVAANCWVVPSAIDGLAGLIAIETKTAAVTVSVVEPVTEPEATPIVVAPTPALVARPAVPAELLMVATLGAVEVHCTDVVMFCVLLSL